MKKLILLLIISLAFFLRVYRLGSYPVGFLWDEASVGYNAYSILKTGKDEYGQLLPIIFKSFGDYKPGFYVYLTVPSVMVFGLNEFSVRFPSALLGSLTVLIFYLLVKESLRERFSQIDKWIFADSFPFVCAVLLAISPWHIMFSRGAWELNVMLFEFLLGFYLLTKFLNTEKKRFLFFSAFSLLTTLITYQSAKFMLPVLLAGYLLFYRKSFMETGRKHITFFLVIVGLLFLTFNWWTINGGKAGRIKAMSIFSYPRSEEEKNVFLSQDNYSNVKYSFFHGSPVFFVRSVLGRYFNHFSGKFLFITGDWSNQRNGTTYQGVLYYLDALFLLIGLAVLFAKKRTSLDNWMLFWLVLAPLPSALTRDSVSSVRSFTMVIPLIYVIATGVSGTYRRFNKFCPCIRYTFFILHLTFYIFLIVRFLDLYFVHDQKFTSENRLFGYKQAIEQVVSLSEGKNKIIFSDKYGQPYIFYLFYAKYDPLKYQRQASLVENPFGDVGRVEKIDNIEFKKIYWPDDRANENSLFAGDEFDLPTKDVVGQEKITLLEEIKFLNGKTAFRIVETN